MSDDLSIPNPGFRGNQAGRYGTGQNRARPGMDPDTRRLTMFAGGLGAVLAMLIGASALVGHHSGEIPVIIADPHPIREKPLNPGGMKIDGAENDVFSGGSDTADSKLAPAPETPDAMALRTAAEPSPPSVETPAPMAAARMDAGPGNAGPGAIASPAAPVAKPAIVASASPIAKPVPLKPASLKSAAVAEARPGASGHQPMVQLAALTSEEAARNEWQLLSRRMPDLLNGHQPNYSRTERDGHTFWRVRTSGFGDVAQARSFCEHVRAKGGGCSVADF